MPGAQPLFVDGRFLPALGGIPDAESSADGQHEGGLDPAPRGRIRLVHARAAFALSDHRVSRPSTAGSEIFRLRGPVPPTVGDLETDVPPLSPGADVQEPQATGPQIAFPHLPDQSSFGNVSR